MAFFEQDFLNFFIELAANNNKDWFDLNRKRYERNVKDPFKNFVNHLINELSKVDNSFEGLQASECIFRINRDIRFSQDKTPYKLQCSAVVATNGKKSKAVNGVYFELGPEHVRVYGGVYEIDKEDLYTVREAIVKNPKKFQDAINDPKFLKVFGKILGDKNKVLPKEFKDAAESEPLIFNKQWYFYKEFEAETVLNPNLDKIILECYEAGQPVEKFFNALIQR